MKLEHFIPSPNPPSNQSRYLTPNYTYPESFIKTFEKYPPFIPETVLLHLQKIKSPILDDPLILEVLAVGRVSDADCLELKPNQDVPPELQKCYTIPDDIFDWSYFLTKLSGYQLQKLVDAYTSILGEVTLNKYYKKYYEDQLDITQKRLKRILNGIWTTYWEPDSETVKDGFLHNAGPALKSSNSNDCKCPFDSPETPWYFQPIFYIPVLVVIGLLLLLLIYSLVKCKTKKVQANMLRYI